MENNIKVNLLIFEVTRRCNMACRHCLRGEAQNMDIDYAVIDKTLSQVSSINEITFTGGEPTLNPDAIIYTINRIMELEIPVYSFFIATNGLTYSKELVTTLIDFYSYCIECGGEEECMGGLAVSIDQFHSSASQRNIYRYKALSFYNSSKEIDYQPRAIINEGMANFNGIGQRAIMFNSDGLCVTETGNGYEIDLMYVNAQGDILNDCDMSYDSQEEYSIGNIKNNTLLNLINEDEDGLEVA